MVPAFTTNRSTREVPSYTPAASPRVRRRLSSWPPHRPIHSGFGVTRPKITTGVRCRPAHIHQIGAGSTLTELHTLVPLVHLLVLLAEPAPSGSSGTPRRCQDCFPPSPASPRSGCPQLRGPAATRPRRRSLTTARSRGASRRTNRSSNRRPASASRPTVQLRLDPQYPPLRLDEAQARCVGIHRRPPGIAASFHCELAAALRHVIGFPDLGLLRRLRPTPRRSTDDAPIPTRPGWMRGSGSDRDGSHVHCYSLDRVRPWVSRLIHRIWAASRGTASPSERAEQHDEDLGGAAGEPEDAGTAGCWRRRGGPPRRRRRRSPGRRRRARGRRPAGRPRCRGAPSRRRCRRGAGPGRR